MEVDDKDNVDLVVAKVIQIISNKPAGVPNDLLQKALGEIDKHAISEAINTLLGQGKIELLSSAAGLVYRLKSLSATSAAASQIVDPQEKHVYQVIKDAGNRGIWVKDVRFKTKLPNVQIHKILKTFEMKRMVKGIKSIQAAKKKLYMLYEVTPHESVTGGAFYSNQTFEQEFVDILCEQCLKILSQHNEKARTEHTDPLSQKHASFMSLAQVHAVINELGISKVALGVSDIESLLNSMLFDGAVERSETGTVAEDGSNVLFRRVRGLAAPLLASPCATCPVIAECGPHNLVSPLNCEYFHKWLAF